jgi:xylulose-5-phosphate/fructose-6-phosphate phosphoketolase
MTVLNELDRYHLAISAIERVPGLRAKAGAALAALHGKLDAHKAYIREHGQDMPEILNWTWRH